MLITFSGYPLNYTRGWTNIGVTIKMFRLFSLTLNPTKWNSVRAYILYDVIMGFKLTGYPLDPTHCIPVGRH